MKQLFELESIAEFLEAINPDSRLETALPYVDSGQVTIENGHCYLKATLDDGRIVYTTDLEIEEIVKIFIQRINPDIEVHIT